MIRIITIEREYGCGGSVIAEKLAARLGWELLDRSLTDEIARIAQVTRATVEQREGHLDPLFYRLGKVFWRGSHERSDLLGRGNDQKLVHAGPVALADLLHLSLQ